MNTEIPEITNFEGNLCIAGQPGWYQATQDGNLLKPTIRCNCGMLCGIRLHHVHADGTVTASFYHSKGTNYAIGESDEGCGWHVFLKLAGYKGGDFPVGT